MISSPDRINQRDEVLLGSQSESLSNSITSAPMSYGKSDIFMIGETAEDQEPIPNDEYIVDRNRPETFLNSEDLERITESNIYPQKRLFSFLHNRRIPHIPSEEERQNFPMFSVNYFSRIFLWWVYPMVRTGYKRTIQPNDLFKVRGAWSIEVLFERFDKNMNYYFKKARTEYLNKHCDATEDEIAESAHLPKGALLKALFFTFRKQFLLAVLCANLGNCASALNPLITKKLIKFVDEKALAPHLHIDSGVGYAIGACLMMIVNGVAFNHCMLASQTLGIQVKSVLTKAALKKTFRASAYARHKYPNGKVTSYVTTDLSRIEYALSYQPFATGFPAVIIIVIVLLILNVGVIGLVGIGIFFAAVFLCMFAAKFIMKYRIEASIYTDARVTRMREVLNNMKMIKFYAWEDAYESDIKRTRNKEVNKVRKSLYIRNLVIGLGMSVPNISSLATFLAMYRSNGNDRSAANIFSSLALFQILTTQMFLLPIAITTGSDMLVALSRLQAFLDSSEEKIKRELDLCAVSKIPPTASLKLSHAYFEWEDFQLYDTLKNNYNLDAAAIRKPDHKAEEHDYDSGRATYSFSGFKDLNFEINKGEFVIITGQIGTGKTSLLNAMAGFMTKTAGHVEVNGDLLLCAYPWIQNATVRDNIIFGSPYDKRKYEEVIRVCALEADLDILPTSDLTEIGERGITLSGGQKARVNLARAVYKNKSIYLFDDILSAVDSHVGKHIIDECLMGLLKNETRILATHQLSLIEKADRIIVLGNDGSFEIGKLKELKKHNKILIELLQYVSQSDKKEKDGDNNEHLTEAFNDEKSIWRLNINNNVVENEREELQKHSTNKSKEGLANGSIIMREERAVNSIQFSIFKEYFSSAFGRTAFFLLPLYIICVVSSTFCNLFSSVWLSYWTENKFSHRSAGFYMGIYSFFVFSGYFFLCGALTLLCYLGLKASKTLNLRAVKRVLHSPVAFFDTTPIGRILNRFTKDTDSLDNEMSESLRLMITQTANLIGLCVLCIVYLPWFAIAIPFLTLVFLVISSHYQSTGREVKRLEAVQRSFVYANFNEILNGLDTIKCYGGQERFVVKTDFLLNRMNEASYLSVALQRWVTILLNLVAVSFALIIALLCVSRKFNISASSVGVLLTYVLQLPGLLNALLRASTQAENNMNSVERMISYATDLPTEADYKKSENCPGIAWPSKGEIRFEDVAFAYRPGLPLVLQNFSASINSGEKIGICGRTGAGKSTIMNAIYRLNELAKGKITIDGIDISKLGLYDLRRNLSIIPQDPVLFRGTVRKNLDPFNERSDDKLWEALRKSGAIPAIELEQTKLQKVEANGSLSNMHKFHLDQQVEEEGFNFSLGERQILALTRTLVRQTKILILDEATSSVDYETDAKIQAKVIESLGDCTILCIAHRINTILNYDRVLVLENGDIAEFDTPKALFEAGGVFAQMCSNSGIVSKDFGRERIF